jgi:hypothetical protein
MSQLSPTALEVEVLVTVEHADGIAAIVRDTHEDGALWLTGLAGDAATELHGYLPAAEPLDGERLVQGGRLPVPAVAAEVVDDAGRRWTAATGEGTWLVVVDQPLGFGPGLPVRYLDAAGRTVPKPLPASWSHTPVDDAPEPCPACAGTGWDHVRPRDAAGRKAPGSVVCRDCGHEEAIGASLTAPAAPVAPPRRPITPDGIDSVPVYTASGMTPRVAGWVGDARSVLAVSLDHGDGPALTVETRHDADDLASAGITVREALGDALREDEIWPQRSAAGLAVWLRTRDRRLRRIAARAPLVTRQVRIDGRPEDFLFASAGLAWAAVRRHDGLTVVLTGRGLRPEDAALERLAGPVSALS